MKPVLTDIHIPSYPFSLMVCSYQKLKNNLSTESQISESLSVLTLLRNSLLPLS